MKKIVLDTSVIAKWYIDEDNSDVARKLYKDAGLGLHMLYAPRLAIYEIGNVLVSKRVPKPHANHIMKSILNSPLELILEDFTIINRTHTLAHTYHVTFYDALFIASAEKVNADLVTDNFKHQGKYTESTKIIRLRDLNSSK